jgi:hypothetical protein
MAQKTDLSISPYFDDFSPDKSFYKVLFNPGKPIQARELNTIQSILQNQIETFGSNIFKDGSVVIPGNIVYDSNFYAIKLNQNIFGIDISLYIDKIIGTKITGQSSGTTAVVQFVAFPDNGNGEVENITLYVKYLDSDDNFIFSQFLDGELLTSNTNIVYGNTTINSGTPFASLISENSSSIGSSASIGDGVYFIRGHFVKVNKETIILDYYNNIPSYRVGLKITEKVVTAKEDNSLYDNAKGFTNFSAPGADRFKIEVSLTKKLLDDYNDEDFVEILRVKDGNIKILENKTNYNIIKDYLAKRTYDESGDYTVNPFNISIHNSLNDRIGNDGLFFDDEKTESGNNPNKDLMCVKISPGKAYVRGYDIEKAGTTILDVEKPRTTESVSSANIEFQMGNLLNINNVNGALKQRSEIEFYNQRKNSNTVGTGSIIGSARVYNLSLTDASYSNATTSWDLYLYDVQTYTEIILNSELSNSQLPQSSFIKGVSSGSSGYVVFSGGNSTSVTLRQTSGKFIEGEQILINGIDDLSRTIRKVTSYGIDDIKSVYQSTVVSGLSSPFTADSLLSKEIAFGFSPNDEITISTVGNVTSAGKLFTGIKPGTIIRYNKIGSTLETFNRVSSVSSDGLSMTVVASPSVSGVCDGTLPASQIKTLFSIGFPKILNDGNASLYTSLPDYNISSLSLNNSILTFSTQSNITPTISGNTVTVSTTDFNIPSGISTIFFESYDAERYSIHYSDGTIENLTSDKVVIDNNQVTFNGISNKTVSIINATFKKIGIQNKIKFYNRSQTINVNLSKYTQSGTGINTSINDGLEYNRYYGLRVQDEDVSLNYCDVSSVLSVYESLNESDPILDEITFSIITDIDNNAIIGENIIGSESKTVARVVTKSKISSNSVGIVYLNSNRFVEGEEVVFQESNISSQIDSIILGSYNDITSSFSLDNGQRNQYYDYSRIVRRKGEREPSRRLLVVFDHYVVPDGDEGDIFTVDSYSDERYQDDISYIGSDLTRVSDTLDFRPRVPQFTDTNKSPFDFISRNFDVDIKLIPTPNESSIISYDFYLGRIDKLYLDKFGDIILEKGTSSVNPKEPSKIDDVMDLATIILPPYLYNPNDAKLLLVDNRRYTMRDIGRIEDRLERLEITTSLSLLELNTQTLQIQDAQGFNRFKTGFFVDDFSNANLINLSISTIEVDQNAKELTPFISRNSIKNIITPRTLIPEEDIDLTDNFKLLDDNVQKTGNTVTLKYDSIDWIEQPFATRVENVNPFHVVEYSGTIILNPSSDSWIRTIRLPNKTINLQNTFNLTNNLSTTNSNTTSNVIRTTETINNAPVTTRQAVAPSRRPAGTVNGQLVQTRTDIAIDVTESSSSSTSRSVSASTDTATSTTRTSNTTLVDSFVDTFVRSRNVEFFISNLKPSTRYYQFFDGNGSVDFVPKLIEIAKDSLLEEYGSSKSFEIGETVVGFFNNQEIIRFRVATPNHKSGPFRSPSSIFNINPYIRSESIPSQYSVSSKVLNIDTFSLSEESQGKYFGYLQKGTILVGQSSGSIAYVKDLRLISDNYGDLIGTFFLRDPNSSPAPSVRITTGNKTYRITSSSTNSPGTPGSVSLSAAETNYQAQGNVERYQTTITNTTNTINLTTRLTTTTNTTTNTTRVNTTNTINTSITRYTDPLAQTFTVGGNITDAPNANGRNDDSNGAYLTAVDLFFATKDVGNSPLTVQVRTVELGTPTRFVLGNPVTLRPEQIKVSNNASVPTKVTFDYPIYLAPGQEYAIVLLAPNSIEYEVWIAEMGEKTVNTANLPNSSAVLYNTQFAMGSLFKSQNGSIWTANQYQDMKFKLYKANFTSTTGTAFFYNQTLDKGNDYIVNLSNNPLRTLPRSVKVGITTTTNQSLINVLQNGRKISEGGVGAKPYIYGYLVGTGSSVSSVGVTTGGFNYPNSSTNVDTFPVVGNGSGLRLNITASGGVITSVSVTNPGNGYSVGDVVGIVTSSVAGRTGANARITVSQIFNSGNSIDTLYLSNVQGNSFTVGSNLVYFDSAGNPITVGSGTTTIMSSIPTGGVYSGNYIRVDHFNHGMYAPNNILKIEGVKSDISPSRLSSPLSVSSSAITIPIGDISRFSTFEGIAVSATNPGYVKINEEIIRYESVVSNTLQTITRGIDSTLVLPAQSGTLVYKYELNGVSLRRINTNHTISLTDIDIDGYYLQVNRSTKGVDRNLDASLANAPQISFNVDESAGGDSIFATENILYTTVIPSYEIITPGSGTSVSATVRTVSGTSPNGNEPSFIDQGFEPVELGQPNTLRTPRIICSNVNELTYLANLPRNKSLTTAITLSSSDPNLSPLIFLDTAETFFRSPRINSPVSDYIFDGRVNGVTNDPHVSVYYSNTIKLSQPANTLKVLISAYRPELSDFRVLYNLIRPDSSEINQSFELFPGYNNLTLDNNQDGYLDVVDISKNSGLPDTFVPSSLRNQFLDYQFTTPNIGLFTGYIIKIVMSTKNAAEYPKIKDLRSIAIL